MVIRRAGPAGLRGRAAGGGTTTTAMKTKGAEMSENEMENAVKICSSLKAQLKEFAAGNRERINRDAGFRKVRTFFFLRFFSDTACKNSFYGRYLHIF